MITKEYFGEGKHIEFKQQLPKNREHILKDIIAFSNTSGGKLILGIEDETGVVVGIGDQSPFKLSDAISTMISDACTPQIEPDIAATTIEDKTVLIIDVPAGKFRPYYLKSKGKEKSTYIRINGTSRPADDNKIKELELEGENRYYDSMSYIGRDYSQEKAEALCKEMYDKAMKGCSSPEEQRNIHPMTVDKLIDFEIIRQSGNMLYPTNAFDLLTDNSNRMAKIQCAVFKGNVRDIFIDRKEFSGSIQKQVEDAYDFVLRHINLGASIEGVYRSDSYELPTAAIREMIANAVVHRSYMAKSCVQVCIFDDRLEVSSPGMLYGGLDIAGAKAGRSVCRNGAIAEAFRYMNIIEAWGTGIPRIIQRCKEYGLQEPVFEEIAGSFRVTIYRKVTTAAQKVTSKPEKVTTAVIKVTSTPRKVTTANEKVTSKQQKVITAFDAYALLLKNAKVGEKYIAHIREVYQECKQGQAFKRSDIQKWLQCSPSQATKILNAMKLACIVHKIQGQGNGMYVFDDTSRQI